MSIKKLPNHLINKLKAGEIVERPYSVLKELVENALDAGSTVISIDVHDGGSRLIKVSDNGSGISREDLDLVLERYATSKISTEQDLEQIDSYGFRGEALASIAEVSKVTLQTKTEHGPVGLELTNITGSIQIESIPFLQPHGTTVIIEDLFYNTPARLKFLKSSQTEYMYLYQLFIDVALIHRDKTWIFKKQGSVVFDLGPARDMSERFGKLFKSQWIAHLKPLDYQSQDVHISGLIGDSTLSFGSADNIKIYVNDRPVQDRIIKKALLSAYDRQIKPGEHPLAIIILNIDPKLVDVNVHPRKTEVRFIDPGGVFQLISSVIRQTLGGSKIIPGSHSLQSTSQAHSYTAGSGNTSYQSSFNPSQPNAYSTPSHPGQQATPGLFAESSQTIGTRSGLTAVGQIRDSYIIATDHESLYYVDQHALAERIGFDQLKHQRKPEGQSSHILLNPIKMSLSRDRDVSTQIEQLNQLSFDIQQLSPETILITAVPEVFSRHPIDLEALFNVVWYQDQISYDTILDQLRATKACKAAIKAGDRLSLPQMQQLLDDGMTQVDGMFVCQHGRPFWIQIPRSQIDKMVDR